MEAPQPAEFVVFPQPISLGTQMAGCVEFRHRTDYVKQISALTAELRGHCQTYELHIADAQAKYEKSSKHVADLQAKCDEVQAKYEQTQALVDRLEGGDVFFLLSLRSSLVCSILLSCLARQPVG